MPNDVMPNETYINYNKIIYFNLYILHYIIFIFFIFARADFLTSSKHYHFHRALSLEYSLTDFSTCEPTYWHPFLYLQSNEQLVLGNMYRFRYTPNKRELYYIRDSW